MLYVGRASVGLIASACECVLSAEIRFARRRSLRDRQDVQRLEAPGPQGEPGGAPEVDVAVGVEAPPAEQAVEVACGEGGRFDLWEPSNKVPVGAVKYRRGWVVVACLGYSRAGVGALIFSKETPDLLWGIARCLWQLNGLPGTLVWDRQAGLCTPGGQPTAEFAALCGRLRVGWHFCRRRDPQAKGAVERLQGYLETNFEPGRQFVNERDCQAQLDQWFVKANARTHRALRCRRVDRLPAERDAMATLPAFPDLDRRWVTRVPADP